MAALSVAWQLALETVQLDPTVKQNKKSQNNLFVTETHSSLIAESKFWIICSLVTSVSIYQNS